jgi:hypothetical protein
MNTTIKRKWSAPSSKYRSTYKKKYGSRCFLLPRENKFPICTRGKIDCKGLYAAQFYNNMRQKNPHYHIVKKKIKTLKKKYCNKI